MQAYGKVFRQLRRERHVTQASLCDGGFTQSALSKFERGVTTLGVDTFFTLLAKINVSPDEFLFIANGYQMDQQTRIREALTAANNIGDFDTIRSLGAQLASLPQPTPADQHLQALASACIQLQEATTPEAGLKAATKTLANVRAHLIRVETWGVYELRLYTNTLYLYTPEVLVELSTIAAKRWQSFADYPAFGGDLIYMFINTAQCFVNYGDLAHARIALKQAQTKATSRHSVFGLVLCQYLQGTLAILDGTHPIIGRQQVTDSLQILERMGISTAQYRDSLSRHHILV
ncbi:Rgg/GadR/MutR family transcriptional regulator [Lacticaseibacillus sp. N501-2]|uniref:Rgg/GadR/MutR family transcriptional regulator n=1 Tax=Lacticaseibacillus salsurae TaxID=3367729 RepID=UPI0038B3B8BD